MKTIVHLVDAFTRRPLEGNAAGLVPDAAGLSDAAMGRIARELNLSETAFVLPSEEADFRVRFFTPAVEVPFCGHAFVGAVVGLAETGRLPLDGDHHRLVAQTAVGRHAVELRREGGRWRAEVEQARPLFRPNPHPLDAVARALGIAPEEVDRAPTLAFTGLWHLLVGLRDPDAVRRARPRFAELAELNREAGVAETHLFAREGEGWFARGFAPAVGVDEDPVTGSASGATAAYLVREGLAAPDVPVVLRQARADGRGGEALIVVRGNPGAPERVLMSGFAVLSLSGEMEIGDE